ncbi:MAG: hypothetical protein PVJ34_07590 [Anaerolineae bacterium]|jgi:hypothetical protein
MFKRYDMSKAYQEQLLRDASGGESDTPQLSAKVRALWQLLHTKLARTEAKSLAAAPSGDPSPADASQRHRQIELPDRIE